MSERILWGRWADFSNIVFVQSCLKKENGDYYIIDRTTGAKITKYNGVSEFFYDGAARVGKGNVKTIKYGCINKKGDVIIPLEYDAIFEMVVKGPSNTMTNAIFIEGLAAVGKNDSNGNLKIGYVDMNGKIIVPLEYDETYGFHNGITFVGKKNADGIMKYGFVDKTGTVVVPPLYDEFYDGLYLSPPDYFSNEVAWLSIKTEQNNGQETYTYRKWGCIDKTGKIVVPFEYDSVSISEGVAIARNRTNDTYACYDKTGKLIALPQNSSFVGKFTEGLVGMFSETSGNTTISYWDESGKEKISLGQKYVNSGYFSEGLAWVRDQNDMCGYIDKAGELVIPCEYASVNFFSSGMARVGKRTSTGDLKYGLIDKTGKVVISIQYDEISIPFSNGLIRFGMKDKNGNLKYGVLNKLGKIIVPAEYESIVSISDELIEVTKEQADGKIKLGYLNNVGKIVVPAEYDRIGYQKDEKIGKVILLFVERKNADGQKKQGLISPTGEVILPVEYDYVYSLGQVIIIRKGDSYGILDNPLYSAS